MVRAAILDDYQNVAFKLADWSAISKDVEVKVFNSPIGGDDAVIKALQGFAIVNMMRERTPFNRKVIEGLPELKLLITTGARPLIPAIDGLLSVPYLTYEHIFDNKKLPRSMIAVGGGPISAEIAQAYQRLGSEVTVVADNFLPKEDPDVRQIMQNILEREGIQFVWGRASAVRKEGEQFVVSTGNEEACRTRSQQLPLQTISASGGGFLV